MSTASKSRPSKTRCEIVDQIIEWTDKDAILQVGKGDLIVYDGAFQQLADVEVQDGLVRYEMAGLTGVEFAGADELVAVRRYAETTED